MQSRNVAMHEVPSKAYAGCFVDLAVSLPVGSRVSARPANDTRELMYVLHPTLCGWKAGKG